MRTFSIFPETLLSLKKAIRWDLPVAEKDLIKWDRIHNPYSSEFDMGIVKIFSLPAQYVAQHSWKSVEQTTRKSGKIYQ